MGLETLHVLYYRGKLYTKLFCFFKFVNWRRKYDFENYCYLTGSWDMGHFLLLGSFCLLVSQKGNSPL